MFTWAKELLSPTVQTGKPVSADSSRRKSKDTDGDVTEDGFVCIGKSSFYQSPEMPAVPHNYSVTNQQQSQQQSQIVPYPATGPATLYPLLPQQPAASRANVAGDNHELVRRIPFNVRAGGSSITLGTGVGYKQQKPHELYLSQFRNQFRERYEYDFNFERGVIREMNQLPTGCYQ